ncbi:MAG TPA: acetate uptake transporter [Solirubrobacterales bacterium]|nr:acetate uptake transporter [Solirubrobacterales bacterium]
MSDGPATTTAPAAPRGEKPELGPARFIAEPAALGLAAFALSTMVLSIINLGVLSESMLPVALGLALAYGGLVQLLAGMWAFAKNDTFSAVALSSYGGFWISFWALNEFFLKEIPPDKQAGALALYLLCWGVFTFYMWIVSMRVSLAVNSVFLTLWIAYLLLGLGKALDSTLLFHLGGAFGVATAACAWYTSFALTANKTTRRDWLPLGETRSAQQDAP